MRMAEGQIRIVLANVPGALESLFTGTDPARTARVMQTMMTMTKIDIARLQQAYNGQ